MVVDSWSVRAVQEVAACPVQVVAIVAAQVPVSLAQPVRVSPVVLSHTARSRMPEVSPAPGVVSVQ